MSESTAQWQSGQWQSGLRSQNSNCLKVCFNRTCSTLMIILTMYTIHMHTEDTENLYNNNITFFDINVTIVPHSLWSLYINIYYICHFF